MQAADASSTLAMSLTNVGENCAQYSRCNVSHPLSEHSPQPMRWHSVSTRTNDQAEAFALTQNVECDMNFHGAKKIVAISTKTDWK